MKKVVLIAFLFASPFVTSCGDSSDGGDNESYATYQDCFDDHVVEFANDPNPQEKAITICCLDHPIGGAEPGVVCGPTSDTCITYVDAQITTDSATATEITNGCDDYETQSGM